MPPVKISIDEAEELFERRQIDIGIELDKEIGIAGFRIEVHAARPNPIEHRGGEVGRGMDR